MISEFLNQGPKFTLIIRPRRWGKTLNMSMLHHFFSAEVNGIPTVGLFDNLAIGQIEGGKWVKEHQGQYPMIMLSFKDFSSDDFQGAYDGIYDLIAEAYSAFSYLFSSTRLNAIDLRKLDRIVKNNANQNQLENSLKLLSTCLYRHHGKRVYILIDEYDAPLNKAYDNPTYLNVLVAFSRQSILADCY